jgi:putative ABC transport system permease protein
LSTSSWAQGLIVSRVGLSSLHTRFGRSLVVVISMACVTAVLLSMLSLADGLQRAYGRGGDPRLTLVTSVQAAAEPFSRVSRDSFNTILNAPGIAKDANGSPLASAEIVQFIRPLDPAGYGFRLRGIGAQGTALRPQFHIVAGRMFRAGARELIAGIGTPRLAAGKTGDSVILPDGEWPIVGTFSAGGNIAESELFGDAETLMTSMRVSAFNSALVQLDRLQSFEPFSRWLTENPALTVKAENQTAFYLRTQTGTTIRFFHSIAYVVTAVLAIGALFGAAKLLYSGVRARTREIATLRAIGYEPLPIAASVVVESIALSLAGAMLGAGIAWLLFDGKTTSYYQDVFQLSISAESFALGAGWALMLALLGGAFPAIRAARLPVVEALRAV